MGIDDSLDFKAAIGSRARPDLRRIGKGEPDVLRDGPTRIGFAEGTVPYRRKAQPARVMQGTLGGRSGGLGAFGVSSRVVDPVHL